MFALKQGMEVTLVVGPFLSPSDGVSPVTGLAAPESTKVYLFNEGTAAAYTVASWSEVGNGFYTITLSSTDTGTPGRLRVDFLDAATHAPVSHEIGVMDASAFDRFNSTPPTVEAGHVRGVGTLAPMRGVDDSRRPARSEGQGRWSLDAGTRTLRLYAPDGATVVRTFTLEGVMGPATRV